MSTRCLIFEKHDKETGRCEEQLQLVKKDCDEFFGKFNKVLRVKFHIHFPDLHRVALKKNARIQKFDNSTYRIVDIPELGFLPKCLVFIQTTGRTSGRRKIYDMWFNKRDMNLAIAFLRKQTWEKARNSGHVRAERGKLSVIVKSVVPKKIENANPPLPL